MNSKEENLKLLTDYLALKMKITADDISYFIFSVFLPIDYKSYKLGIEGN